MIKTIITQLEPYIQQYPNTEQELIKKFIDTLAYFEEADKNRKALMKRLKKYNQQLYGTDLYYQTPFLWFTESYFDNASIILRTADYKSKAFYEYLVGLLRRGKSGLGVFALIRGKTSVKDPVWSKLQSLSHNLINPLTQEQLVIIEEIYRTIRRLGVHSLDEKEIQDALSKLVPRNPRFKQVIGNYFELLRCQWVLTHQSSAFGIERVFFHFKLLNSTSVEEIIDFTSPDNSVLGMSDVYNIPNASKTFLGIAYVPKNEANLLHGYLHECEKNGQITIHTLSKLITTYRSISFQQYKEGHGWIEPTIKEITAISTKMEKNELDEYLHSKGLFYLTPTFNQEWFFKEHSLPTEIIKFYCQSPSLFEYPNLPLTWQKLTTVASPTKTLNQIEKGLLKYLYTKGVIQTMFIPWRLVYDYSFDLYMIILPRMPLNQLKPLLRLMPYAEIYELEDMLCLRGYLSPELIQNVSQAVNWPIHPIRFIHSPKAPNFTWFEKQHQLWRPPKILNR
jgi:hypothetical protein